MSIARREFLFSMAALTGATVLGPVAQAFVPIQPRGIKAVAFDAFPIFDPRPIFALAEQLFPGKGAELSAQWRIRQFEYTWLRTITGQYADFWSVTEDALRFAGNATKLEITPDQQQQLMNRYLTLTAWPDVLPALQSLKEAGLQIGFLSNFTPTMLQSCIDSATLKDRFDFVLSTDAARTYKPDPKAYQLGIDHLGLRKEEILFVAFAGWDAAGAKAFGYPTYWVNRLNQPAEELDTRADASASDLKALPAFLGLG